MEKHLLLTVSEQQSGNYGVQFVGHFFSNKKDIKLTLFYAAPKPPAVWEGERTHETVSQSEQYAKQYENKGRKALEAAKKELVRSGFEHIGIGTKFQIRKVSKVMDIIQEGEKGLYDAVVLGRRGLSWLEEAFDESVSKGVLEKKVSFPIWICRKPELDRKGVLVCVDGSDEAYRMVDHVGFIMGQEKNQEVTLLLVNKPGATAKETAEVILSKAREHLLSNGFPAQMAKSKVLDAARVANAILEEAEQGRFAAVAVGRTGVGQGFLKRVFMGSVSEKLFQELEGIALWICH